MKIFLNSSSSARKDLLARLQLNFECRSPEVDETPLPHETAQTLVQRLALLKATAFNDKIDSLSIGCDQVASCDGQIFGKPLTSDQASIMLSKFSDRWVKFHNGLCVFHSTSQQSEQSIEVVEVKFKKLNQSIINNYLSKESALNCAGGLKSEGLGVALLQAIRTDDPSALIGLPLIQLISLLAKFRFSVL